MRVLITFFPIDDMGGIINHHEQLCAGLKDLGHEVTTKLLVWRDAPPRSVAGGRGSRQHSGLEFDQRRGFSWGANDIIAYKGQRNLLKWKEYAEQFDLIIWQVAVPTKRKENRGNLDWLHLYRLEHPKQVAVIHDGNFLASYPWLYAVADQLDGLACVHNCAFNSAQNISVPSFLIPNPFEIQYPDISEEAYADRRGALSVQTWKAWKRVPELLRAMLYARHTDLKLAGKGIDYYYLTSKDKCKYPGVWDAVVGHGVEYLDVITNEQRDKLLGEVVCSVDASWSKKYAAIGAHFNRVQVEAIMRGAVPVVRDIAVAYSIFKHDVNCLTIPWDATPQEFAELLDEYCTMPYDRYRHIMENAVALLPNFERAKVAQDYLDLAHPSLRSGVDDILVQMGITTDQVKADGADALVNFFKG